jgi:hypothetical protein
MAAFRLVLQDDLLFGGFVRGGAITPAKLGAGAMRFITGRPTMSASNLNQLPDAALDWDAEIDPMLCGNLVRDVSQKFESVLPFEHDPKNQFSGYTGAAMIAIYYPNTNLALIAGPGGKG